MKFSAYPLLPFSLLYEGVMRTRNWLYDRGWFKAQQFPVPVISVGNLTVGGTGKTPHVEYLVRLLQSYNVAILSRGYRRQTKGFVLADARATAATIGDEPYLYYKNFPEVRVAVCEKRVTGIKQLLTLHPRPQVLLLDDAFQHRAVKANCQILISDYHRLFYQDYILPAGRLRESRKGVRRANCIVVSKSPQHLTEAEKASIRQQIYKYTIAETPVYFSGYQYQTPVNFGLPVPLQQHIIVVTGIAQPAPFIAYLQDNGYTVRKHFAFPDHHAYTPHDVQEFSNFAQAENTGLCSIVTTQKDWTKLSSPLLAPIISRLAIFYIPIRVKFLDDPEGFEQLILNNVVEQ